MKTASVNSSTGNVPNNPADKSAGSGQKLSPNQNALQVLPKILAAAAALGVGGRLAVATGGMAPKALTDVNRSKSILSMPDVHLLSQAEQERAIEEQRLIDREWEKLCRTKTSGYDSPYLAANLEYAAKLVHETFTKPVQVNTARIKQAAFSLGGAWSALKPYTPELIGGTALLGGGLLFANAPKSNEDSIVARAINTPSWIVPRTSDILNKGESVLPAKGGIDGGISSAIELAKNEAQRASDPVGTFTGKYAKSIGQVPWLYPAAAALGSVSLLGGYKLTDSAIKARAKRKREKALVKARKQFEDALLLEQEMGDTGKGVGKGIGKTASALDEFCNEVERQPAVQKLLAQQSSAQYPLQKTAALLDYYLAALGTTAAMGGLFGLSTGYGAASRTERLSALQRARELQLARRREDETRVKLIAPETPDLFFNNDPFPLEDNKKTDSEIDSDANSETDKRAGSGTGSNKSLQSELNAGKTAGFSFNVARFGRVAGVPAWAFEKTAKLPGIDTLLYKILSAGTLGAPQRLGQAASWLRAGFKAPINIPSRKLPYDIHLFGRGRQPGERLYFNTPAVSLPSMKDFTGWGARQALTVSPFMELGGALTGFEGMRPTNIFKKNIWEPHIVGNNTDPRYTRTKEWVSAAHNRDLAGRKSWLDRLGHMMVTPFGLGNVNEYIPTYTFKKIKVRSPERVKVQRLDPNAVMYADPSTALRRATAKTLSDYNSTYSNTPQRPYY
jgi:hypothetical protein